MMGFGFGFPFMALFWILLIGLGVWAVVRLASNASNASSHNQDATMISRQDAALEVLKQRYARGEITKSEYEAMRQDLMV